MLPKTTNDDNLKHDDKYRTLCDPYFPLLRDDDYAVSKALYDKQLSQHYTDLELKAQTEKGLILFLIFLFYVIIIIFCLNLLIFIDLEKILKTKKPVRPTSIPLNLQALGKFRKFYHL